jgi:isopenicillin-N N-acyltransferase like protein
LKAFVCLFVSLIGFCSAKMIHKEGSGYLEIYNGQRILHLSGSPYEMGYQHGMLLKDDIRANIKTYLSKNSGNLNNQKSDSFFKSIDLLLSYLPEKYLQELKGVADGANIKLKKIILLNLFPEMFHCSAITAKNNATVNGDLYHVRVLDYAIGKGLQEKAVLIVQKPENGNSFINVSYAGFIGVVTGMNDQKISVGEIGAKGYGKWDGMPMTFIIREILENSSNIEVAKKILMTVKRTCEYFYVIADGNTKESVAAFATPNKVSFVEPGENYKFLAYLDNEIEVKNQFFERSDEKVLVDQIIYKEKDNATGTILNGQPKDVLALTGFNYKPYPTLYKRLKKHYGNINEKILMDTIKSPIARNSNLHNVIFSPCSGDFWIAHAGINNEPAYDQKYAKFNIFKLLQR